MTSAWVIGGTVYPHQTDAVRLTLEPQGEAYELVGGVGGSQDGDIVLDVRGVRVLLDVSGALRPGRTDALGGSQWPHRETWIEALRRAQAGLAEVAFRLDTTRGADLDLAVVPDLSHRATLLAMELGTPETASSLRLRSRRLLVPTTTADLNLLTALARYPVSTSLS